MVVMKFVLPTMGKKNSQAQRVASKDICKDRIEGTRKARDIVITELSFQMVTIRS